ncbi:MAG: integration host factor subunit beta [Bacteroidetes bacterium]|nr:integration host factor subunit beta [Bacteroidota bacterium]
MTKAEIVTEIVAKTDLEKPTVIATVEAFMETIKSTMAKGENIYIRGFGTFLLKKRAAKVGRNISKGTSVFVPAHTIAAFKPAKEFTAEIRSKVKVK